MLESISFNLAIQNGKVNRSTQLWVMGVTATPIPEPASVGLLLAGGLVILRRRFR